MKNVTVRILAGTVYGALIVLGLILGQYAFLCLFSCITALCLNEFYGLIGKGKQMRICSWYHALGGVILFVASYLYASGACSQEIFILYLLYLLSVFIIELYAKHTDPITHIAYVFFGQCYIALPLSLLNGVAFLPGANGVVYFDHFLLALFVFIWMNDTGAYTIGVLFGKHRLFPRISPKKSWEGFFGGLLFTLACSLLFVYVDPTIPRWHWLGIALAVVILGTFGDLVESLIKRSLGVKDSGTAIPGHGGFLDRFDSFLLAAYALIFYFLI